jgi:hypothetical protein
MKTLLIITFLLFSLNAFSQSFYAKRGHSSFNRAGMTIKKETVGQKIRTKVQYNRKRHHNEGFAFREMRRKSRGGRL